MKKIIALVITLVLMISALAGCGDSEADGLLREVVRMGEQYQVPTPSYRMVAEKVCGKME